MKKLYLILLLSAAFIAPECCAMNNLWNKGFAAIFGVAYMYIGYMQYNNHIESVKMSKKRYALMVAEQELWERDLSIVKQIKSIKG